MNYSRFLIFIISIFTFSMMSCVSSQQIAYFTDVQDSALIASKAGLEPVIQKKDILSISVSSLSAEATIIFNTPNLPVTLKCSQQQYASNGGLFGKPGWNYQISGSW